MRRIFIILTVLMFSLNLRASVSDSLASGNEAYKAEKYEQAITAYQSILDQKMESVEVYFNLGNAYYKTGDLANAILYYEKAKLLAPGDEDIQFNLDLANKFVVDQIEALPQPFFVKWIDVWAAKFTANQWGYMSIILFVLALALGAVFFIHGKPGIKKLAFSFGIFFLVISAITFGFGNKEKNKILNHNKAIVFAPTVTVKASPDESGTALFVIHEGLKVEIIEELGSWMEIKIADGNSGWVKKDILEKI